MHFMLLTIEYPAHPWQSHFKEPWLLFLFKIRTLSLSSLLLHHFAIFRAKEIIAYWLYTKKNQFRLHNLWQMVWNFLRSPWIFTIHVSTTLDTIVLGSVSQNYLITKICPNTKSSHHSYFSKLSYLRIILIPVII